MQDCLKDSYESHGIEIKGEKGGSVRTVGLKKVVRGEPKFSNTWNKRV